MTCKNCGCCPMLLIICSVRSSFCKGRVQKPESRKNPINAFPILSDVNLTKLKQILISIPIYIQIFENPPVLTIVQLVVEVAPLECLPTCPLVNTCIFPLTDSSLSRGLLICASASEVDGHWSAHVLHADLLDGQHICCMLTIGG